MAWDNHRSSWWYAEQTWEVCKFLATEKEGPWQLPTARQPTGCQSVFDLRCCCSITEGSMIYMSMFGSVISMFSRRLQKGHESSPQSHCVVDWFGAFM